MRGCCCGCARSAVAPPSPGQWTCRASMWWQRPRTHPAAAAARPSRAPDVPPASAPTGNAWLAGGHAAHCACCPAPARAAHPACCARCCRDRALNGSAGVEKDRGCTHAICVGLHCTEFDGFPSVARSIISRTALEPCLSGECWHHSSNGALGPMHGSHSKGQPRTVKFEVVTDYGVAAALWHLDLLLNCMHDVCLPSCHELAARLSPLRCPSLLPNLFCVNCIVQVAPRPPGLVPFREAASLSASRFVNMLSSAFTCIDAQMRLRQAGACPIHSNFAHGTEAKPHL